MGTYQGLAIFILITQFIALVMMVVMLVIDSETFEKIGMGRSVVLPGLIKVTQLFRQTPKPIYQGFYLLIMIFVLFSYAAAVILVVQFLGGLL